MPEIAPKLRQYFNDLVSKSYAMRDLLDRHTTAAKNLKQAPARDLRGMHDRDHLEAVQP